MTVKALRATLLAAVASLAAFCATVWFGAAAVALSLLASVPVAFVTIRYGVRAGALALALAAAGSFVAGGQQLPLVYLAMYGSAGLVLPMLLRRQWRWDRALLAALLLSLLGSTTMIWHGTQQTGLSVSQIIQQEIDSEIQSVLQQSPDRWSNEQKIQVRHFGEELTEVATKAWPAMVALGHAILLLVTLWALSRMLPLELPWVAEPFSRWRSPEWLVWGVIGGGFALLLPPSMTGALAGPVQTFGWNVLILLVPVFFLQGLAVLVALLERFAVSPVMRALILVMVFLFNPLPLVLASVGLFDIWADFRKPRIKT